MSVVKYIGRTTDFRGKTLWEIVGNLKNGGVGRIVVRSMFERYPEPSFMKICKIEGDINEDPRKVKVWVEKTFRGNKLPKMTLIHSTSYKTDYRLLSKDEEEDYCKITQTAQERVFPSQLEFPPLMKEMLLKEYAKRGVMLPEDFKLSVKFKHSLNKNYRQLGKDETSEVLPINIGTPISPSLYADIPLNG